jgi:hypothetical protein
MLAVCMGLRYSETFSPEDDRCRRQAFKAEDNAIDDGCILYLLDLSLRF